MSISTEISRLTAAKADIKTAIEAKGVTVPTGASIAVYDDYINDIPTGGTGWQPPSDWIDISTVGNNEINLLISDNVGTGLGFTVTLTGTYSIDWGDGNIEHGLTSGIRQHQYARGGGQGCSLGYTTYKCKIYNATGNITVWKVARHTFASATQYSPILWAVFGTENLTSGSNMFYLSNVNCYSLSSVTFPSLNALTSASYMFASCCSLASVTLPSLNILTNGNQMFYNCYSLSSVTFPSLNALTSADGMFSLCYSLSSAIFPNLNALRNAQQMFYNCYSLRSVTFPSLNAFWNAQQMFQNCYSLSSVTVPNLNALTNGRYMFASCYSLTIINNIENIGTIAIQCDLTDFGYYVEQLLSITLNAMISMIWVQGSASIPNKTNSIRLLNANSPFTGTSPQINVSYCNLSATALNTLFGDLPTLTGKTIKITGCTGAATCDTSIATAKGWIVTN